MMDILQQIPYRFEIYIDFTNQTDKRIMSVVPYIWENYVMFTEILDISRHSSYQKQFIHMMYTKCNPYRIVTHISFKIYINPIIDVLHRSPYRFIYLYRYLKHTQS